MKVAAAVLVLLLAALYCLSPLAEVDFFWHLLAGRQILETGRPPHADTFTYTSAGREWIDLHWLFQAAAAWIEGRAGWGALDAAKTALVVAAFAGVLLAASARRAGAAGTILALPGVVAAQERFTLRPEIVSFALLGLLLLILARRESTPRGLIAIPPLIALWANLHALFAVGLAAIALTLAGDALERRGRAGAVRPLLLTLAAAVPCTLLTPYGFSAWRLAGRLLFERVASGNLYGRTIAEFQPPFGGFGLTASVVAFAVLIALVLIALAAGRSACRPADALLLAAFLGVALLARRNMPLFALVAVACAAPAAAAARERGGAWAARLGGAGAFLTGPGRWIGRAGFAAVVLVLMLDVASNRFFARDGTQRSFGLGVAPSFYPERAADWVIENAPAGEVLNDMATGGYLAWRWAPARRTYIDGRLEVHDPTLFAAYTRLQRDPRLFEAEAAARDIRIVVWSHQEALEAAPLLKHLASDARWRLAQVDLAAAVFVRDGGTPGLEGDGRPVSGDDPQVAALLEEAEKAAAAARAADPLPSWLRRLLPRTEIPAAETGAGIFFASIDRPAIALALLRDAARRAPWSALLRHDLGLVLAGAGRPEEAARAFEEALAVDPALAEARAGLALMRLMHGDERGALEEWSRAESYGDLPAASHRARGALLAERGRIDEAIGDYRAAVRIAPDRADWLAELGMLYVQRGMDAPARDAVRRARALDPAACLPRVAEARLLRAAGDTAGAEAALRAALEVDPACAAARADLGPAAGAGP